MNEHIAARLRADAAAATGSEPVLAVARGYALGWTSRYQKLIIPMLVLCAVTILTWPSTLATGVAAEAAIVVVFTGAYLLLGRLRPPGAPPLRTNQSVGMVATDRRLVLLVGSRHHRRVWRVIDQDEIDDVVLHRALVGVTHGGVVSISLLDGDTIHIESPGLVSVHDLTAVVDVIR